MRVQLRCVVCIYCIETLTVPLCYIQAQEEVEGNSEEAERSGRGWKRKHMHITALSTVVYIYIYIYMYIKKSIVPVVS